MSTGYRKTAAKKSPRTCVKGHAYYKTGDCHSCPVCELEKKPQSGFLAELAAPARRALENEGITTLERLSKYSEKQVLSLHGMGKSSIPKLRKALASSRLDFAGL